MNPAFLIRLKDVPNWHIGFYRNIANKPGYNEAIEHNLEQLERIFKDYKLVLVRIQGVDVTEVAEIFERINQEGKRLDPVDIIVAKTYRNEDKTKGIRTFYLRDNLQALRGILSMQGSRFQSLDDLSIIQMVAICLRKQEGKSRKSFGITPKALDNLKTDDLENNWDACQKTIFEVVKFLSDMKIQGPDILPFGYLVLPICHYFYRNNSPNRQFVKQWFWSTAFRLEDFRRADEVYDFCTEVFDKLETGEAPELPPLTISKNRLIKASYYYRSALSRAVLAFLAKQNPLDFSDPDAEVLDNVYLLLSQAPNLHHIYPQNFLKGITGLPEPLIDSLMNICYLRAKTNIRIGDANPLHYFKEFEETTKTSCAKSTNHNNTFDEILRSHLIPREFY